MDGMANTPSVPVRIEEESFELRTDSGGRPCLRPTWSGATCSVLRGSSNEGQSMNLDQSRDAGPLPQVS